MLVQRAMAGILVLMAALSMGTSASAKVKHGAAQCTAKYTACVLSCNAKSVKYAQRSQNSLTVKQRNGWQKRLREVQSQCIPMCYQVHCLGKTPKAAAKALEAARRASKKRK